MELIQLRYFKITAELENISKAAIELQIPQPYLSVTIKKLENELGTQLFDRIGKRVFLNDAGKIFLKYTNQVILDLNNASLELKTFRKKETQDVTISFQSASMFIPQLMKEITEKHPNLRFSICQQVNYFSKDIDLAICSSNKQEQKPNERFLLKEELLLILPKTHPLSNLDQINIDDLQEEPFISLSEKSNLYNIIKEYYEQMNFTPKIRFYIDNPSVMRDMLCSGFGISIIPATTWYNMMKKDMVLKPIKGYKMERYLYLSWNPQKYQTREVKSCINQIVDFFKNIN